jgi:hypothetical protein
MADARVSGNGTRVSWSLCKWLGHKWVFPGKLRYKQGHAMAYVGDNPEMEEVNVTYVCDEVCARCGGESWWPT